MIKKTFVYIIVCILSISSLASKEDEYKPYKRQYAEISDYDVDIIIHEDGKITVTESIVVYADGMHINKGIVRSLPTIRKTVSGEDVKVPIKVLNIMRDEDKEDFLIVPEDDRLDIFIGNRYRSLEKRWYKYDIVYETYGQIGFFDDYDELYWNVTGNEWAFDINKVTARVKTPKSATIFLTNGYTGKYGEKGSDYSVEKNDGTALFKTTYKLRDREGFTIALSFTPNIINRTLADKNSRKEIDYLPKIIGVIALVIMIVFCLLSISLFNKKERLFYSELHKGVSPGALRYFYYKEFDKEAIVASLLNMEIKHCVKLTQEDDKYYLEKTKNNISALSWDEKLIYNHIFANRISKVWLTDTLLSEINILKTHLEKVTPVYWSKRMMIIAVLIHLILIIAYTLSVILTFEWLSTYYLALLITFILLDISILVGFKYKPKYACMFYFLTTCSLIFLIVSTELLDKYTLDDYSTKFMFLLTLPLVIYIFEMCNQSKRNKVRMKMRIDTKRSILSETLKEEADISGAYLPYAIAMELDRNWTEKHMNYREFMRIASPKIVRSSSDKKYSSGSYSWSSGTSSGNSYSGSSSKSSATSSNSGSASRGGGYSGGGGGGGGGRGW